MLKNKKIKKHTYEIIIFKLENKKRASKNNHIIWRIFYAEEINNSVRHQTYTSFSHLASAHFYYMSAVRVKVSIRISVRVWVRVQVRIRVKVRVRVWVRVGLDLGLGFGLGLGLM